MDEKKKMLLADFALLLAATFWGMGFVAGDMAAKAFPTFWIMTVRFLGAAVWMGLLFRRAVKSSTKEDIKAGMILGGLLFLAQPLQIIALRYTTPSKQAFLVTTYVIIVPFISWLVSFYQYLTAGGFSLITMLILGEMPQAYPLVGVGAMAYLMIVNTVGAYTLQNIAQRYTSDTHSAVLLSMESVIGYFCGVVLYGDPFTTRVLIGGLIVFGAVLLSVLNWKEIFRRKQA